MKSFLAVCFCFLMMTTQFAYSANKSGGDRVGNGGGLAEQNFIFTLQVLPDYIDRCLDSIDCRINIEDRIYLVLIRELAESIEDSKSEFIFLSGKEHPEIFHNENDPEVRLAKTGSTPDAPIYVNLDLLYLRNGSGELKIMEVPTMVGNLIHELGHQVGNLDHSYLDSLGAKVRHYLISDRNAYIYPVRGEYLEIIVNNFEIPSFPVIYIRNDKKTLLLDLELERKITCERGMPIGATLTNGHWVRGKTERVFKAWLATHCQQEETIEIVDKDLEVRVKEDLSFTMSILNF